MLQNLIRSIGAATRGSFPHVPLVFLYTGRCHHVDAMSCIQRTWCWATITQIDNGGNANFTAKCETFGLIGLRVFDHRYKNNSIVNLSSNNIKKHIKCNGGCGFWADALRRTVELHPQFVIFSHASNVALRLKIVSQVVHALFRT